MTVSVEPVDVVVAGSTVIVASPVMTSSERSEMYIFCFPGERNVIHLLNFFCPASSVVKAIAFPGLGTVSPIFAETNMIDPR